MPTKLDAAARSEHLSPLLEGGGWRTADGGRDAITKTFTFQDFNEAFGFMTRVAIKALQVSISYATRCFAVETDRRFIMEKILKACTHLDDEIKE